MQIKKTYADIINNISQISLHSNTANVLVGNECSTNSNCKQLSSNQTCLILGKNIHPSTVKLQLTTGF